jgi:SAM-dependent methyltransferase
MQPSLVPNRCRLCPGPLSLLFRSRLTVAATSACLPASTSVRVYRCGRCGLTQKLDAQLVADYAEYGLFENDATFDKIVRRPGQPDRTRSEVMAETLLEVLGPRDSARVLDVGCHRGAFLKALQDRAPHFELHGFDLPAAHGPAIERLCGPGHYHHGDLARVTGPFDACVLIHTFEHIPGVLDSLATFSRLLVPGGVLLILVPDCEANPADLYTADHTSHFTADTLRQTLGQGGFAAEVSRSLIANELFATARPGARQLGVPERPLGDISGGVALLEKFEAGLEQLPDGPCQVFGTAVFGILVSGVLGPRCVGFVDEAPFRIGTNLLGRPVRHPRDVAGQTVVLGVAPSLAGVVTAKLQPFGCRVVNPWQSNGSSCDSPAA